MSTGTIIILFIRYRFKIIEFSCGIILIIIPFIALLPNTIVKCRKCIRIFVLNCIVIVVQKLIMIPIPSVAPIYPPCLDFVTIPIRIFLKNRCPILDKLFCNMRPLILISHPLSVNLVTPRAISGIIKTEVYIIFRKRIV